MNRGCSACGPFVISDTRSAVITVVVIYVCIVDDRGPVINGRAVTVVISVHVAVVHIPVRQECPVESRNIDVDIDVNTGAHGCPSVVSTATSPVYPGRCPFITGNPCPSVVVVVIPSSIVERCPAPRVIRYPGVAVIGHHPISVGSVRMKVPSYIRNPNPAISAIVDPSAVRPQFIVENIERDAAIITIIIIVVIIVVITVIIFVVIIVIVTVVVVSLGIQTSLRGKARRKYQSDYRENE